MSNELMNALAQQSESGAALYDGRDMDDAVVAPALRRVRRARTVRAAGTLGITALVLAGGVVAAAQWQGDRGTVAPAVTDVPHEEGLTADDLRPDTTVRTLGVPRAGQAGIICTMAVKDNPYAGADFSRADSCPAVWVGDSELLAVTRADVALDGDGTVHIAWTLSNTSTTALTVDEGTLSVALLSDPDVELRAEGNTSGDRQLIAASLWSSTDERIVQMEGHSSRVTLDPGESLDGLATLDPQMFSGLGTGGLLDGMSDGSIDPTVSLQVRVPPAGDAGTRELFLEASAIASTRGSMDPIPDSFEGLEPRSEGETRDNAQEAVVCHVGEADNPRFQPDDGDGMANWSTPNCDAVWIPGGKLLELTDMSISQLDNSSSVVAWSATNVSGGPLYLDEASMGVSINLGDVGYIENSDGVSIGWNGWNSGGTRHAFLSSESRPVTLAPGDALAAERMVSRDDRALDAAISIFIRVVREDDENGVRELLLEVPWAGESAG